MGFGHRTMPHGRRAKRGGARNWPTRPGPAHPARPTPARPGLPQAYPRPTPGLPQAYPRPTPGPPQASPRPTPGLPQACPRPTPGRPQACPRPASPIGFPFEGLTGKMILGRGRGKGGNWGSPNTPIPWKRRSSRGLGEMEPTGYCWQTTAGHSPCPSRTSTGQTCTDSYGDCAAAQAPPKNDLIGQYLRSAARHFSISSTLPQKTQKKNF